MQRDVTIRAKKLKLFFKQSDTEKTFCGKQKLQNNKGKVRLT